MVEKAALSRRVEARLRYLREDVEALTWHGQRFGTMPAADRGADWIGLEAEWWDTIDRFESVHQWFLDGKLSPEQAAQHRQNLALLAAQLPAIRQLGLRMPSRTLVPSPEETATPGS